MLKGKDNKFTFGHFEYEMLMEFLGGVNQQMAEGAVTELKREMELDVNVGVICSEMIVEPLGANGITI